MLDKLISKIDKNCINVDKELVKKAYNLAAEAHSIQKRESGEPYLVHPIEVACILAEMGMDTNTIVAGLLHDVIEDTHYSYDDIEDMFNEEVANLVDGVTKLGKIQYKTKEEQQADNVRKMLLAMTKDIRVILIKLADRLHNLRTLKFMPIEKQKQKAKETFDIYAPLAHRLGMSKIKWELEDLSFRYMNPNEYYDLVKQIAEKRIEREAYTSNIINDLQERLLLSGIETDIEGRPKHLYSIYRKMTNKNKSIDQIFDLTAIRILVNNIKDCYAVLGIVHTVYKPIPGRFKDYIAMPKPNMYQSLHTTVIGPQGKTFEIQIRTFDMHKTAEYGIAAHWKYKEGQSENNGENFENKLSWIRDMLEWQRETSDAEEFMEAFKIDLFSDEVFLFTPKGVVINLPNEATAIDFAYRIHTDIGNRCIGAKVNGKMVPLDYHLKTGEIVEILTSSTPKGPSIDWLNIVKSNQAKSKIRSWFKKQKREENILKGKDILEKESKKQGYNFGELTKTTTFQKMIKKYNFNSIDDLYAVVGSGTALPSAIVSKLKEEIESTKSKEEVNSETLKKVEEKLNNNANSNKNQNIGVTVKGLTNVMVRFAKCCNPVPGDNIIGYTTKGRGISVHRKDCKNIYAISDYDKSRFVEVGWGNSSKGDYITEIQVQSDDRNGILADIMIIITELKIHLETVNAKTNKESICVANVKMKITNVDELKELIKRLKGVKGVIEVYRVKN
ncbi:RelA/SpoT family protein [Clostridium frigidicarnis]|uniref:GTP diphosphokinase n=1 Tax=Clostridium frigidicarnis TaxID=84698 RepID=A0A1I0VKD1_9CLOT|nr:bifunctional (p)ppGpp synthetase/guanosine-3',5'-bis(diphosphate) 3'-pyrophosphohydrolase [Clostridium frigidicarnis]SFA76959.1 GTP pyrophosphokinase [Clostridium frigidicarnis]